MNKDKGKSNFLENMIKGFFKILKSPFVVLSNIFIMLKFSIRTKINMTYLMLYSITCFISLFIVVIGYFYYIGWDLSSRDDLGWIKQEIEERGGSYKELADVLDDKSPYRYFELLIQNEDKDLLMVTSDRVEILNFEDVLQGNGLYQRFPELSMIRYALLPIRTFSNGYYITIFYDITTYKENIIIVTLLMVAAYVLGIFFIWVAGSFEIKKILKTITQINDSAQKISGENLDMRIDVSEAKYELKDLALTINDMIDRIQDSYIKQQRFVSDVSHELRTPISVITGYANMLDRWGKENPEVLQESIDALKNEASNMGDLVEKLLFLARHDRDTLKYEMISFNLSEMIEDIAKETQMIDKNHRIHSEVIDSMMIMGDHYRIKQVMRIFMDNAIKYTPQEGEICIRGYKKEEDTAVIEIQDWGIGISKEDLNNIFDRFYRADISRTKDTGGHGLGLSIAKIIILQHGGRIKVKSKIGYGSIFIIEIPTQIKKRGL
ncbi:MAG: sensor histidine kinase [Eubacteriales bacterium]